MRKEEWMRQGVIAINRQQSLSNQIPSLGIDELRIVWMGLRWWLKSVSQQFNLPINVFGWIVWMPHPLSDNSTRFLSALKLARLSTELWKLLPFKLSTDTFPKPEGMCVPSSHCTWLFWGEAGFVKQRHPSGQAAEAASVRDTIPNTRDAIHQL